MQQSVGEIIRQLRRQRSLTQTELGGDRFSKSYVSAVEREKITPSPEALRFFAKQLDQSHDYFQLLAQNTAHEASLTATPNQLMIGLTQAEVASLLETLYSVIEQAPLALIPHPLHLAREVVAALPKQEQACYALLMGMSAQRNHDYSVALFAFEQALVLALLPDELQLAILHETAVTHYLIHEYEIALTYHKRALKLLQDTVIANIDPMLRLKIHLQCASTYQALKAYRQASQQYEQAQQYVSAASPLQMVAQLYSGLAYCTYAYTYQNSIPGSSALSSLHPLGDEEMEKNFQHALKGMAESRTLYHICGDLVGESAASLVQVMIVLDLCTRRQHRLMDRRDSSRQIACASELADAEEQCRRIVSLYQQALATKMPTVQALEELVSISLAYLVRLFVMNGTYARLNDRSDVAQQQVVRAMVLCEQVLDSVEDADKLQKQISDSEFLQERLDVLPSFAVLGPLRITAPQPDEQPALFVGKQEVYFAAGEVMEAAGAIAPESSIAHEYYEQADRFFRRVLSRASVPPATSVSTTSTSALPTQVLSVMADMSDRTRRYQRYIGILEERMRVTPGLSQETIKLLLAVLKEGLSFTQTTTML